jgi:Asp-tRNA(Asn)/Glu-tRNA(Gln) amidotransferase A subunit family amidase
MSDMNLADLTAEAAITELGRGAIKSVELVEACLARIAEREDTVRAWAHLDRDFALQQARACDEAREAGRPAGPLHGVPVGVKDIFDTRDLPTENGTVLDSGRQPTENCTVVNLLREAGAVILGKTVTTELAVYHPGETTNPHDPARTPGGSSSGSAAAVASCMVPLAIGTQTNGSVIRPAAFCGIYGFKPTHGRISRHGVLLQSPHLDHVGVFARSLGDTALLAETLMAFDDRDPAMRPAARPRLAATLAEDPPAPPALGFVKLPVWDQADPATAEAFAELTGELGESCDEVELPEPFNATVELHATVMHADLAKNFAPYYERGKDRLSDRLRAMIERGQTILAVDYNRAVEWRDVLNAGLERVFERYDAIITPATPGEAPVGLETTGSPVFCTLWTYCGVPAVTLPLMEGPDGMPLGVQLVGRRGEDGRLLRTARWMVSRLAQED